MKLRSLLIARDLLMAEKHMAGTGTVLAKGIATSSHQIQLLTVSESRPGQMPPASARALARGLAVYGSLSRQVSGTSGPGRPVAGDAARAGLRCG